MEEFLLCGFLIGNELNIVYQQNITAAVFVVEGAGVMFLQMMNQFVGKVLTADIQNHFVWFLLFDLMHNCRKQMRFSKSGMAVNKQRIISFAGIVGNIERRGMCEAVGGTDDEIFKGIDRIFIRSRTDVGFRRQARFKHSGIVGCHILHMDRKPEGIRTGFFYQR